MKKENPVKRYNVDEMTNTMGEAGKNNKVTKLNLSEQLEQLEGDYNRLSGNYAVLSKLRISLDTKIRNMEFIFEADFKLATNRLEAAKQQVREAEYVLMVAKERLEKLRA